MSEKMSESVSQERKISPIFLAIVLAVLLLSVFLIYGGIDAYMKNDASGNLFLTTGITILALLAYMVLQTRRRVLRMATGLPMQPVTTTMQCQKCGFKNVRDFQRGDYIFKETEQQCPKCNEKMSIASIYREVKEKRKEVSYS